MIGRVDAKKKSSELRSPGVVISVIFINHCHHLDLSFIAWAGNVADHWATTYSLR